MISSHSRSTFRRSEHECDPPLYRRLFCHIFILIRKSLNYWSFYPPLFLNASFSLSLMNFHRHKVLMAKVWSARIIFLAINHPFTEFVCWNESKCSIPHFRREVNPKSVFSLWQRGFPQPQKPIPPAGHGDRGSGAAAPPAPGYLQSRTRRSAASFVSSVLPKEESRK